MAAARVQTFGSTAEAGVGTPTRARRHAGSWRRHLRLFAASSRRTRVVNTIKRVSKRYGTRPGIKIKRFQKILVSLATSGSIDIDALELFFGEVHGIWRNGADITVIECACLVPRVYPYRGKTSVGEVAKALTQ